MHRITPELEVWTPPCGPRTVVRLVQIDRRRLGATADNSKTLCVGQIHLRHWQLGPSGGLVCQADALSGQPRGITPHHKRGQTATAGWSANPSSSLGCSADGEAAVDAAYIATSQVGVQSATPFTIASAWPAASDAALDNEQPHDHLDSAAEPVLSSEYSAGGNAGIASFSSSPGWAHLGMLGPG